MTDTVAQTIRAALLESDPYAKVRATRSAARDWRLGRLSFVFDVEMPEEPGRPSHPVLLPPAQMPRRGKGSTGQPRIALWHSLAHIEFVAIDLALDMAGRFGREMGEQFTGDFLMVAAEEAMHFVLLDRHLRTMGSHYGVLPAHGGLWSAAQDTRGDVAARLAVVPMVLEARGLDVTPGMLAKVRAHGDRRGARILERILDDEIRHVRFGAKHFTDRAERMGAEPANLWKTLVQSHFRGAIKPPFNDSARLAAGLPLEWYAGVV